MAGKIITILIVVLVLSAAACKQKKTELPSPLDYSAYITAAAEALCTKMIQCSEKLYRTISPDLQQQITVDKCREAALENLEEKLKKHTPAMKQYSVLCYTAVFDAPCNQFAAIAIWNPACAALKAESEKVYLPRTGGR